MTCAERRLADTAVPRRLLHVSAVHDIMDEISLPSQCLGADVTMVCETHGRL
jgi:hypothetical protein